MKLLLTTDAVGGAWTFALELGAQLAAGGHSVTLAVLGPDAPPGRLAELRRVPGVRVLQHRCALEWMPEPWAEVESSGRWLLEVAARERPDVVHLGGYAHAALPFEAPVVVTAHSCVLSWWRAVHGTGAPPQWRRYAAALREGLQRARLVVAPTGAMLRALEAEHGRLGASAVIPNGRRPELFPPLVKAELVLCAGRLWDPAKNLAALEAAARHCSWPVACAGPGGSGGAVRPLGELTTIQLARWLGRAAIFALPALYEPFGLAVLEAALAGCALVLGDIASLRELWEDAAVFVDPRRPDLLAGVLNRLAAAPAARSELAGAARRRALELSPQRMAAGYLKAYAGVLSHPYKAA